MTIMNARTKAELENQLRSFSPDWWLYKLPAKGARNAYKCNTCGICIITIDVDRGTTPAFMGCKATKGCDGSMTSAGYPSTPMPKSLNACAVWEWYRPEANALGLFHEDQIIDEHIRRGGLLLRRQE